MPPRGVSGGVAGVRGRSPPVAAGRGGLHATFSARSLRGKRGLSATTGVRRRAGRRWTQCRPRLARSAGWKRSERVMRPCGAGSGEGGGPHPPPRHARRAIMRLTTEQWQRVKKLFNEVVDIPPTNRAGLPCRAMRRRRRGAYRGRAVGRILPRRAARLSGTSVAFSGAIVAATNVWRATAKGHSGTARGQRSLPARRRPPMSADARRTEPTDILRMPPDRHSRAATP